MNMASPSVVQIAPLHYRLSMELHELPVPDNMQEEEEEEEFTFIDVELRLIGSITNYRRIAISVEAAVGEDYMAVFEVLDALTELGVAASSRVSIIVNLFEFIERSDFYTFSPSAIPMVIMNMEKVAVDDNDESAVIDEDEILRQVQEQRELLRVAARADFGFDFSFYFETPMTTEEEDEFDAVASESMEVDTWGIKTMPASEAAIAALEKVYHGEVEGDHRCVICDEDGEKEFTRMPCLHVFHTNCLVTWLRTNGSCPLCRFQLPC